MSETPELNVQMPGDTNPDVETGRLEKLLSGNVDAVLAELDALTSAELRQLEALERAGKARTTILGQVTRELDRRDDESAPAAEPEVPNVNGDTKDYRHLPQDAVDPRKLQLGQRVLTKDGWVVQHPSAAPKE